MKEPVRFIFEMGHLRRIKREGVRLAGVEHPESVAEHSLRAAQLGFLLATMESYPCPEKVATALLFHDMSEARVGDIHQVANGYVSVDEERAVNDQCAALGDAGARIREYWLEVERADSALGRIAKDADRLEMAFAAKELAQQYGSALDEWFESSGASLVTRSAQEIFAELRRQNPSEWWAGLKHRARLQTTRSE